MGKKRGFFAELQHQNQLAQKRQEQQNNAAARAHAAAVRKNEAAQREYQRLAASMMRLSAAEQKAAERESKRLHEAAMLAEVEQRNAELRDQYEQIDGLLAATLDVDDFVDLEDLREMAVHPPFTRPDLELAMPRPTPLVAPLEPRYVDPEGAPKGLGGVFGGKKKYAELVAQAQAEFAVEHQAWSAQMATQPAAQQEQGRQYQQMEQDRLNRLAQARSQYDAECRQRDEATAAANSQLDTLIANLAYDVDSAVQEYVSIVLGNSVYPDCFPVDHDFEFNATLRELTLTALVPAPQDVPNVKEYKYVKAKDEISSTTLPVKEQKDRYSNAVAQVALRTLQEVFEADRAGKIQTISFTAATEAIDAATGLVKRTPLLAVAAERTTFMTFDLSNVVPSATLQHMGALISKNPFDLVAIDTSKGVRGR